MLKQEKDTRRKLLGNSQNEEISLGEYYQAEKLRGSLKVSSNRPQKPIAASQGVMVGLLGTV